MGEVDSRIEGTAPGVSHFFQEMRLTFSLWEVIYHPKLVPTDFTKVEYVRVSQFQSPRQKFQRFFNAPSLFVVVYIEPEPEAEMLKHAMSDVQASIEGGADAIVLINEESSFAQLDTALTQVRGEFPNATLGANFLGDETEPYGFQKSFELAQKHHLQLVWTDFSGVDAMVDYPPMDFHRLQSIDRGNFFYCSGIQFKYGRFVDTQKPIETSALQAMGWLDGINISGSATGVTCEIDKVKRVRTAIGNHPIGLASGVNTENVGAFLPFIDYALVGTSLMDPNHRIIKEKVTELKHSMTI